MVYKIKSNFNYYVQVMKTNLTQHFYSVLYIQDALEGPNINRRVFLDPNQLSDGGTVALTGTQSFSKDGEIFAYGLSTNGADWRKVYFLNVSSNQVLDDVLIKVKFTNLVWKGNEGIFYGVSYYHLPFCSFRLHDTIFRSITQISRAIQKDLTLEPTKIRK